MGRMEEQEAVVDEEDDSNSFETNLRDSGDEISRQMASMYRNFQKVKDDDRVSDEGDTEDSGDDNMRDRSCVDTEDDVNQMTDLDADESSMSARLGPLPKGQIANLQRKKAAQNGRDQPVKNSNRGKAYNNQRGQNNLPSMNNTKSRDSNANDVSSDITTTTTRNVPLSGMDGDAEDESDEDTLSESECSGNCLCCSSIASYQGIPWTIRRPSSAETTEYDSDSSECSDYEDDRYRSKRAPLHARLSPFFHQECSHSESSSPLDEDVEEVEKRPVKRMSPLGCESPSKTDALPEAKRDSKPKSPVKGAKSSPPKPAPKPASKPTPPAPKAKPEKSKEIVKPERKEKDKTQKQEVSLSEAVALGAVARSEKSVEKSKKKSEDNTESSKQKSRHVSKTAIVLLDPEAEFKDGDTIKKKSNFLPQQQPIEVPLSYVDKNGRITLTPDPKLAPEAYKAGKTITFRVRAASSNNAPSTPDGSMIFTPTSPGTKPTFDNPPPMPQPIVKPVLGKTVLRVGSTESPPVSLSAEEIGHEHQIQVSPEGIIRLSKRKPVPMQVFLPQFQQQQSQQQPATIRLTSGGATSRGNDSCPSCHRKASPGLVQQLSQPATNVASNVRVIHMSPGITPSPVQPAQPQQQSRVQVIQRQNSMGSPIGSPPMEGQHVMVQQQSTQAPQRHGQHIVIKRQDSGNLQFQVQPEQQMQQQMGYQRQIYPQQSYTQQTGYPQEVYQQQSYSQPGYSSPQIQLQSDSISIPIQQGNPTYHRQVIHQSGPHQQVQPQVQQVQTPSSSGVTTIRFGDGAPIKVTPGQGMRFVINPK
nr:nucleolar protein dao-5-like [Lytechinus pictus]